LAKEAEAAGTKAKNIDLCQLTVPGTNLFCVESKGIPRVEMPQLKGIPNSGSAASDLPADKRGEVDITEAYLERLRSSGVSLTEDEALASHLKATQNELNGGKVAGIMQAARAGELDLNQPIVVSKDGYIVDGHHRWAAKVALEHDGIDDPETDMKIPVVRVDQDILDILESSKQFAADMGLPQMAVKSLKHADHDQSEHGNWATGNAEKTGPQAWLGITKLSDVPKYKIGSPSEASEPQVAARIATNIAEFKAAGGVVTRLPILPNAGVTGSYSYAETPEQEATSDWVFREAESARASANEYELRAQDASSQEEQDRLLAIASGYSHMATALDRASGSGTFIATTGGERGTIVGVLAGSFNSGEWEGTMFGSSQSVAGTGSALMYAAIEAVADADRVSRLSITFPEPESLPFYRAFGLTPEIGTWESKPNPSGLILARGSAVRIDQAVSGMTPESIVAQYGLTKSLKHGDHDQSDHGSWAHGGGFDKITAAERKDFNKTVSAALNDLIEKNDKSEEGNKVVNWAVADRHGWSNEDVAVLRMYTGQGANDINESLRGDYPKQGIHTIYEQAAMTETLDRMLASGGKLPQDMMVYRGMSFEDEKAAEDVLGQWKPGQVWTDPGFGSTSVHRNTAQAFANGFLAGGGETQVLWEINAPEGNSAFPMWNLFTHPAEQEGEILFPRDAHYRIDSVESKSGNPDGFAKQIVTIKATMLADNSVKSVKHGDHDQSDHGNWATAGADHEYTGKPRSANSRARMGEHTDRYGDPERRESGRRSGSRNLGREVTYMEIVALESYKGGGYGEINRFLRGTQEGDDWTKDRIDAVKSLALPTTEPMTVTRMMPLFAVEGIAAGQIYEDKGFMSTGKGDRPAQFFHGYPVQMQIEVPAGTPVVDFDNFSGLDGWGNIEREVTLMPSTQLVIDRVEQRDWNRDFGPTETDGLKVYARLVPATKSIKHADHDQSDHGNWATGGGVLTRNAERFKAAGGTIDKPVKATDSPRSDYATPTGLYGGGSGVRAVVWHWDDLVNKGVAADDARTKAEEANMNLWETTKLDIESPEYEKESDKFQKAFQEADRLALGYKLTVDAITSTPFNEVIVARGADGGIVGALA
jgi:hypothetical protein